ncbi:glycosyltransferase family 4 protein [Anaeromyxobacter sp. SG66]|uniref:glycosyltransferase family 4 protein n=1 Tax=Anaeromyxobacter sp. SG66 TaxID=2925410 RepID=UPI001F55F5B1|nr:glycosyltransferase family 4 protein [Anaeromyxobacter sp. SG66]
MNLLLINHYAGSPILGMEYRPYYMARAWQKLGHRTRIVASSFSHLRSRQPDAADGVTMESIEGVEYCWLPGRPYQGNGLGRVANMMGFVSQLFLRSARITEGFVPDVVIASSTYPLDALPAYALARRHGARLVEEIHDLWPLSPMELGNMPAWHPFIATMQLAENFAYKRADKVVSMLPNAEQHMREHGLAPGKFVYVPNGVDVSEWEAGPQPLPAAADEAISRARERFPFLLAYAGAHGLANALGALVEAAALLRNEPLGFVLVGQGPEKAGLQRAVADLDLQNVFFLDPVPKYSIPSLLSRMDGLYIGWRRNPLYRFGISPNKLMDYMMSGRPVIHAVEAANDLVAEAGCGLSVEPEDPSAIAAAVRQLASESPATRAEMGRRGRDYVLAHHTYDVLSRRFLNAVAAS